MMTTEGKIVYRDRLTGRALAAPEGKRTLVGRWRVEHESTAVFMNSVPVTSGDFLVPDESRQWSILTNNGEKRAGVVARPHIPGELEAESVRTIGRRLDELIKAGATWLEWFEVVPLVPGISEQIELQPLERLLHDPRSLGALKTVCWRPRTDLMVEVERGPVSRARRIPPSAVAYLASHTEDWERPMIRGVMPRRVLTEVRYDQLDTYENRVAARLIDNLIIYLGRRIEQLRNILSLFREKEDYSHAIGGTYQRTRRLSELWGASIDASEGRKKAERTLRELESLRYRLMGLLGSPLYQGVPRRATVGTTLKATNVLMKDPYYRHVAELWRGWANTGAADTKSPTELYNDAQLLSRSFDSFAMLLIIRALDILGYEPDEAALDEPIRRGMEALSLPKPGFTVTLSWNTDGIIDLKTDQGRLTVVALTADLAAGSGALVDSTLEQLKEAAAERRNREALILFLPSNDAEQAPALGSFHTVGNDPRNARTGGACLPVSPWILESTERVARALRWFILGAAFLEYPPTIDVEEGARALIKASKHGRWLQSTHGGATLELRAPPHDYEWNALNIDSLVHAVESELEEAETAHRDLTKTPRDAARQGKAGSLPRQKAQAKAEVVEREKAVDAARSLSEQLKSAYAKSTALLICPTCGQPADPGHDFEHRDKSCFYCKCTGCNTTWGTRLCSAGHRYAMMLPSGNFLEVVPQPPGWEDRAYGSDLLAVPAQGTKGQWGFVCPDCGVVN